jgi:hypothetical protein
MASLNSAAPVAKRCPVASRCVGDSGGKGVELGGVLRDCGAPREKSHSPFDPMLPCTLRFAGPPEPTGESGLSTETLFARLDLRTMVRPSGGR